MATVTAPVKSAWASKINWTQGISVVAANLALFGVDLDAQTQAQILAGIVGAQAVVTWVQRTFFTMSLTASSVQGG